ncbi:steroidogenic factor 1-like [Thalassophryne amazonica]|uniref:steroidogenic factor 1-like n=1 Tax=Thalassophryne amazonica TaxID=390379 RepID=UPI001471AD00|nr:steroidogenic factor 1-like [Thalassophryne amazonica]
MQCGPDEDVEDLCPVCGDKVSGYHYGLLTCESCKGFFKRTVQNNKKYICAEQQDCRIDKTQRKRCPYCRFQKCLHVGMRLEAVRPDRMRGGRNKFGPMYKRDRALKQQRKALMQAAGFRLQSPPLASSRQPRDYTFPDLHPVPVLQNTPLQTAHDDCVSFDPFSLFTLMPTVSPGVAQYPYTPLSNWTNTSETSNTYRVSLASGVSHRIDVRQLSLGSASPQFGHIICLNECLFSEKVCDQMKLLNSCWSELLVLDIISRQVRHGKVGSLLLVTGQEVALSVITSCAGPILTDLVQRGRDLTEKFHLLKVDCQEFACIKFLILFNPDVKHLEDHQFIERVQQQVQGALLEYTLCTDSQYLGRFARLLLCVSELRSLSPLLEDYLYCKHLSAEVPNSLLIEMLHAKRSGT